QHGINGYLTPIDNINELAKHMILAHSNYGAFDGAKIAADAKETYGCQLFQEKYEKIYQSFASESIR
ncbi:MAG: hypothetical protein R6W69_09955, partial [Anaerolineales bacterium]